MLVDNVKENRVSRSIDVFVVKLILDNKGSRLENDNLNSKLQNDEIRSTAEWSIEFGAILESRSRA